MSVRSSCGILTSSTTLHQLPFVCPTHDSFFELLCSLCSRALSFLDESGQVVFRGLFSILSLRCVSAIQELVPIATYISLVYDQPVMVVLCALDILVSDKGNARDYPTLSRSVSWLMLAERRIQLLAICGQNRSRQRCCVSCQMSGWRMWHELYFGIEDVCNTYKS